MTDAASCNVKDSTMKMSNYLLSILTATIAIVGSFVVVGMKTGELTTIACANKENIVALNSKLDAFQQAKVDYTNYQTNHQKLYDQLGRIDERLNRYEGYLINIQRSTKDVEK